MGIYATDGSQNVTIVAGSTTAEITADSEAAVTVGDSEHVTIATITNTQDTLLVFHFDVATQALEEFKISGKAHSGAQLQVFGTPLSSWTDPDAVGSNIAAGSRILATNGNLDTVAAGSNGYFEMDISGLTTIVVSAQAAAASASVTPRWTLSR